jgi:cytoskeletal protein CcmA (bactofilin family)
MAQIIKHRRGSITQLKDVTARVGELIVATGSINDLNGPLVFVGETEGVAGAYRPLSKIYQGNAAPSITVGSHGSVIDGTPFYASGNKTLYILNKDGNAAINLTGNIEGNTISGVTINNLTGSTATIANISGSFTGSGEGLYNIPASGITGLELNRISEGSATASISQADGLRVNTNTEITGALIVTGDITGSNLELTGNANIGGNIVLGGNITIGDTDTDVINFGGEVSSSIIPDVHNAFDLGSPSKNWKNLHVSGTAYVDTLEARQVNFSDLGILQDLTVSGSTYLGNGGDIIVTSGSLYNDQLTENRVVIVGTQGLLEDDANYTFDGTTLKVGKFEIDQSSGDVRTSGSLMVDSSSELIGSVGINSTLDVTGSATLKSTLEVNGATGLNSTLDVTGSTTLKDSLSVSGTTTVAGVTILQDTLTVDLTSELKGAVGINSTLDVTGSATLKSTLEVVGNTSLDGTLIVTGSATLKDNLSVSGTTTVAGVTILQDTLTVNSTSEFKGAVGVNSTLDVTGSAQFKSTIDVDGEATLSSAIVEDLTQDRIVTVGSGGALIDSSGFTYNGTTFKIGGGLFEVDNSDGDVRTSGSLTVEGGQTINGDTTINGVLTVTGNTELQSNLYISGNLEVLGSATSVTIQSTTVELDDNIIRLNAYSPFERYAGFEVIDSGSTDMSASLLWDGQNDYWLFMSSSGESSKLIGTTAGTYGTETSLTDTFFPIATGPNTIGDSLLRYSGTTLSFNTNKFTIDSGTGDTLVSGNFTLSYSGGTDNGTNSSAIMFKNSSNVVGFVSTTESTDVLDGILGYKNSDGALTFSTVIDGGTY